MPSATLSHAVRKACMAKVGLNPRHTEGWYQKWLQHTRGARFRGLECTLTFTQYLRLASRAGLEKANQVGKKPTDYCLARYGDVGGYTSRNCRFILSVDNLKELHTNGRMVNARKKASKRLKGQTKDTLASIAKQADTMTGRTKKTHLGLAVISDKNSKNYVVFSPTGIRYKGRNLKELCIRFGLNQSHMSAVCRGSTSAHKEWTGYYEEA